MKIEFVSLCPDDRSQLRDDGYCFKCASVVPRRKAFIEESANSLVNRLLALREWVEWRCPIDGQELDLNFVVFLAQARFPTGLHGAGWCQQCRDKVWLRDAEYSAHPVAQRLLDQELEEPYEKARAV